MGYRPRRPLRMPGLGDTPQTFQQALAATGWTPGSGKDIPFIATPPGGWPDINPATGQVIQPVTVVQSSGGPAGDQMGQALQPTPVSPGPAQTAAPAAATQPPGIPAVPVTTQPQATGSGFLSMTWFGLPAWFVLAAGGLGVYAFNQGGGRGR